MALARDNPEGLASANRPGNAQGLNSTEAFAERPHALHCAPRRHAPLQYLFAHGLGENVLESAGEYG